MKTLILTMVAAVILSVALFGGIVWMMQDIEKALTVKVQPRQAQQSQELKELLSKL